MQTALNAGGMFYLSVRGIQEGLAEPDDVNTPMSKHRDRAAWQ